MQSVTKPQTQDICEGEKICILCTIEQLFSTTHGSQDCDKVDAEKSLPDFVRGIVGATDHDQSVPTLARVEFPSHRLSAPITGEHLVGTTLGCSDRLLWVSNL